MLVKKLVNRAVMAIAVSAGFVGAASAAIDTSEVVEAVTAAGVAIAVVGAAVLAMHVGGKAFKWIKGAV